MMEILLIWMDGWMDGRKKQEMRNPVRPKMGVSYIHTYQLGRIHGFAVGPCHIRLSQDIRSRMFSCTAPRFRQLCVDSQVLQEKKKSAHTQPLTEREMKRGR